MRANPKVVGMRGGWYWGWVWLVVGWVPWAAWGQVRLELRVPAAETYVLGDSIPLYWRFSNASTQPLGFMWEGCCRLNGRLEVKSVGGAVDTVPSGQALAHMFAKADRLEPGVAKDYDTRVSDWVELPGTGTYEMRGMYRGVLPTQFPQVQRGLALWRDMAESAPIRLSVLSVADYLGQRQERERARGLRLALHVPRRLRALETVTARLTVRNATDQPRDLLWPDAGALWVLDSKGVRAVPAAVLTGSTVPISIPPHGEREVDFVLAADRFEAEPFGEYRVFVDLAAGGVGEPRVPSGPVGLSWRVDSDELPGLVEAAAGGAAVGARNAPLKFLRLHLQELGAGLRSLERSGLSAAAGVLADRLSLASRLRPLHPKPGTVELRVTVEPGVASEGGGGARMRWQDPGVREALASSLVDPGVAESLAVLLAVRRHLGWEVELAVEPSAGVAMGEVWRAVRLLEMQRLELGGEITVIGGVHGTNAPARLVPLREPGLVGKRDRLRVGGGGLWWGTEGGGWTAVPEGDSGWVGRFETAAAGEKPLIVVDARLEWGALRGRLGPVLESGARLDLSLAE